MTHGSGPREIVRPEKAGNVSDTVISDRTKFMLTWGGAIAAVIALLGLGRYWGSWETRVSSVDSTLARHEQAISSLNERSATIERMLLTIQGEQAATKESILSTGRISTVLLRDFGDLKVAMAQRGITVRGQGD